MRKINELEMQINELKKRIHILEFKDTPPFFEINEEVKWEFNPFRKTRCHVQILSNDECNDTGRYYYVKVLENIEGIKEGKIIRCQEFELKKCQEFELKRCQEFELKRCQEFELKKC